MENGEGSYRRFLEGDASAFDSILLLYRADLIRFICSYVHDPDTAEDIAVDCFTYLLLHPKKYRFTVSLKSYLFMLGRSRAIDFLRRRKKFTFLPPEDAEKELVSYEEPVETVIENERRERVNAAVDALPDGQKQAIRLVYYEGLSYRETAKVLGKSEKQVDNLLRLAKRRLKLTLAKKGDTQDDD